MLAFNQDLGLLLIGLDYHDRHFRLTLFWVLDISMPNALVIRANRVHIQG